MYMYVLLLGWDVRSERSISYAINWFVDTETAKLISTNFKFYSFSSNPLSIHVLPSNTSGCTVHVHVCWTANAMSLPVSQVHYKYSTFTQIKPSLKKCLPEINTYTVLRINRCSSKDLLACRVHVDCYKRA